MQKIVHEEYQDNFNMNICMLILISRGSGDYNTNNPTVEATRAGTLCIIQSNEPIIIVYLLVSMEVSDIKLGLRQRF